MYYENDNMMDDSSLGALPKFALRKHVHQLVLDYQEMHNPEPETKSSPPSSLEALRMINQARPALIHNVRCITPKGATMDWSGSDAYEQILSNESVTIAVNDDGLADSVRMLGDGTETFVKPLEEKIPIKDFLKRLRDPADTEALYLQSQDGNIYRDPHHPDHPPELSKMQEYFEPEMSWMQEALGHKAEAVNLWIGGSRSVTSFHHDPFENVYHVLSGTKTFTLVSPIEGLLFDQRFYLPSTLHRVSSGQLEPIPDQRPSYPIPWVSASEPPAGVNAISITLRAGESLYLPAGWWHRVSQNPGKGGLAVAINYWYPAETNTQIYAYERLARRVARQAGLTGVIPVPGDDASSHGEDTDGVWGSDVDSGQEWEPSDWGR